MKTYLAIAAVVFAQHAFADDTSPRGLDISRNAHGYLRLDADLSTSELELSRKLKVSASSNDASTAKDSVVRACYNRLARMTAEELVVKNIRLLGARSSGMRNGSCGVRFPTYRVTVQLFQAQVTGCTAECTVVALGDGSIKSTCESALTFTESPLEPAVEAHAETWAGCPRND